MRDIFRDGIPPPIDLPDLQLDVKLWGTYVIGRISDWIDCDANESWLADLSCIEIEKVCEKHYSFELLNSVYFSNS